MWLSEISCKAVPKSAGTRVHKTLTLSTSLAPKAEMVELQPKPFQEQQPSRQKRVDRHLGNMGFHSSRVVLPFIFPRTRPAQNATETNPSNFRVSFDGRRQFSKPPKGAYPRTYAAPGS